MFISKYEVINQDYLKVIENVVICPVCTGIIISPCQCEICGKCFCIKCYADYVTKNNRCPSGCEKNKNKDCRVLRLTLSKLKFSCHNNCNEEIPYDDLENHYNTKCKMNGDSLKYKQLKIKYDELLSKMKELKEMQKQIEPRYFNIKSTLHKHCLVFAVTNRKGWNCDICRETHKGSDGSFYCTLCDFDLCTKCAGRSG